MFPLAGTKVLIIWNHSFISEISDHDCFLGMHTSGLPLPSSRQGRYEMDDPHHCSPNTRFCHGYSIRSESGGSVVQTLAESHQRLLKWLRYGFMAWKIIHLTFCLLACAASSLDIQHLKKDKRTNNPHTLASIGRRKFLLRK